MAEFFLRLDNQDADTLETAMLLNSLSSVLHQCFLIMLVFLAIFIILLILHNKKNAPHSIRKHSHKHHGRRL